MNVIHRILNHDRSVIQPSVVTSFARGMVRDYQRVTSAVTSDVHGKLNHELCVEAGPNAAKQNSDPLFFYCCTDVQCHDKPKTDCSSLVQRRIENVIQLTYCNGSDGRH